MAEIGSFASLAEVLDYRMSFATTNGLKRAGLVIWLTGLPASGKTTLARALETRLSHAGLTLEVLDGDEIRAGLSADLGFSAKDREEHNRRVIFITKLLSRNGINVAVPLISPYRKVRAFARQELGNLFTEVWVKCSLEECISRDPKGLYARALRGEITDLTGLQDPYENPLDPDLIVDTEKESVNDCVDRILLHLGDKNLEKTSAIGGVLAG